METLINGTPMPPSYIQRERRAAAVPGRGGQAPIPSGPKGTDMRTSRVRTARVQGNGRRAAQARVRPTGGKVSDDFAPVPTRSKRDTTAERRAEHADILKAAGL
jgi:hypothetical protein